MHRIPETLAVSRAVAGESYQEQDPDGRIRTLFLVDHAGSRKIRRQKQRHHPYFHKTRTGGRLWELIVKENLQARD